MTIIVLDTSVMHKDFYFNQLHLNLLFDEHGKTPYKIYIPEVVLDEHKGHFLVETNSISKSIISQVNRLNKHTSKYKVNIKESLIKDINAEYKETVDKILEQKKIQIIPYPSINHKEIVNRMYERKKPFNITSDKKVSKEKGYKDYLIWLSIIKIIKEVKEDVFFITNNTNDFCNSSKEGLHEDLLHDLTTNGIDAYNVSLYHSLEKFYEDNIQPNLKNLEKMKDQINTEEFGDFDLNHWLWNNIFDEIIEHEDTIFGMCYSEIEFDGIYDLYDDELTDIFQISENQFLLKGKCIVVFIIYSYTHRSGWDDTLDLGNHFDVETEVDDWDWNDHVIRHKHKITYKLNFELLYDKEEKDILNTSIIHKH